MSSRSKWIITVLCGMAFLIGLSIRPICEGIRYFGKGVCSYQSQHSGGGKDGAFETPDSGFQAWISPKGNLYVGIWKNGCLSNGTLITDKSVYEGQLFNLTPHGYGIMYYNNGNIYKGNWKNGYKNGIGLKQNRDGSMYFGHWDDGTYNAPKGVRYKTEDLVYGIDLSYCQHSDSVKWNDIALYADSCGEVYAMQNKENVYMVPGISAIIKSTQGARQDPQYRKHIVEARKHKIVVGSYHFFTIDVDVDVQIRNYIEKKKKKKGDIPPVLDLENENRNNPSAYIKKLRKYGIEKMQSDALRWLKTVEENYQVKPIIYTSDRWKKDFLNNKEFDRYELWISKYHNVRPEYNKGWHFWQRTDMAFPNGYRHNIDVNLFRGSYCEFVKNRNATY